MVQVTNNLFVPNEELTFTAARSGGPGGQNVNKVSTKVTLLFDVEKSAFLNDEQRSRIRTRLASRINKEGLLQISVQETRSQAENRRIALDRFADLLRFALTPLKKRKRTRIPRAVKEQRLKHKKLRSRRIKDRKVPYSEA